jgi:hypothetical protein
MEGYHLYRNGFKYSYQQNEDNDLKHLYEDYVQHSDLDLMIDEYLEKPENEMDFWYIKNLDILQAFSEKFPSLFRRISSPLLGKMMSERGFETMKRGRKKTTCYVISSKSKILGLIDTELDSYGFNNEYDKLKEKVKFINDNKDHPVLL